ncbi:MAG: threonine synthase [Rhodospirillales bacterium]
MTTLTELGCSVCERRWDPRQPRNVCECGGPLLARYDLDLARRSWSREWIKNGPPSMWRYAPVLPVRTLQAIASLGEGMTPLVSARRLGQRLGAPQLWIKDEGQNPTGSIKARGFSCAVSMAVELGIGKAAVRSGGNAASALAAYAAAAGIEAQVFLTGEARQPDFVACRAAGARVTQAGGGTPEGWFDMSALCEPYRVEGSKTIGYEIAEQMDWRLPDAILYPTGSGAGVIGMWKAFSEMEALGWISSRRPKLVAVQAEGCCPVVRAFEAGAQHCEFFENAATLAGGIRVPKPAGDFLILRALRESGGTALAVSDAEMLDAGVELAALEGIFPSPEGAACVAALRKLLANGVLTAGERIVICNTGSGLKYHEAYSKRFPQRAVSEEDKLGGLITPR